MVLCEQGCFDMIAGFPVMGGLRIALTVFKQAVRAFQRRRGPQLVATSAQVVAAEKSAWPIDVGLCVKGPVLQTYGAGEKMSLSNRLGLLGRKEGGHDAHHTDDGDAVPVTVLDVQQPRDPGQNR